MKAPVPSRLNTRAKTFDLEDGAVVIAAITSCTNTSNPAVMLGAGLLARNAVKKGLKAKPWVKTSLGPGSRVVTDYLVKADVLDDLDALGFNIVGYGCTTCIGNSGPLPEPIGNAIREQRPGGLLRAVRQPQLRRPRARRREDELPGLTAAGGRLCAGRQPQGRPDQRPAG